MYLLKAKTSYISEREGVQTSLLGAPAKVEVLNYCFEHGKFIVNTRSHTSSPSISFSFVICDSCYTGVKLEIYTVGVILP
jgi:hypothetical protein